MIAWKYNNYKSELGAIVMFRIIYILLIGSLIPYTVYSQTTLYACTKNGHTTLQNSYSTANCDSITQFRYPIYNKQTEAPLTLDTLPTEKAQAGGVESNSPAWADTESLGGVQSFSTGSFSPAPDNAMAPAKCQEYMAQLENARQFVKVKHDSLIKIGPAKMAELKSQIQSVQSQIDQFCKE